MNVSADTTSKQNKNVKDKKGCKLAFYGRRGQNGA